MLVLGFNSNVGRLFDPCIRKYLYQVLTDMFYVLSVSRFACISIIHLFYFYLYVSITVVCPIYISSRLMWYLSICIRI